MYQFDATHPSFLFLETMKMKIWNEYQSPPLRREYWTDTGSFKDIEVFDRENKIIALL